jgi:hypothetical protein
MEDAVAAGDLEGSMHGLKRNKCKPTAASYLSAGSGMGGGASDDDESPEAGGCRDLPAHHRLEQSWGEWPPLAPPAAGRGDDEGAGGGLDGDRVVAVV